MYPPTLSSKRHQSGLTLVELVMFIIIVGVGIAGTLAVMDFATRHSADPMVRKQALAAAESLLEEVQLKEFANPAEAGSFTGPATQANRPFFDDIGDYNGFTTNGIFPADGSGAVVPGLGGYTVNVAIAAGAGAELGIAPAQAARITVTVTQPDGVPVTLVGYRGNY
jgi:MSHA pilin protein MshD